jgi:hypothetical protein
MKANEIDAKLQADFKLRRTQYGEPIDQIDPILRAIFLTFSGELAELYNSTDDIHLGFLDQLMSGLGIEPRTARPAQTVVRMLPSQTAQVPAGTPLQGQADSGEILPFLTDAGIVVSNARIAAAFSYREEKLQLLGGVDMPDYIRALRPGLDPVPSRLGPHAAIYLAIENLPAGHIGRHGLFLDLSPNATVLRQALRSAVWCLADAEGAFGSVGLLRPKRGNAGVQILDWLESLNDIQNAPEPVIPLPSLPDGFYSGRVFAMPPVEPARQFLCPVPLAMEAAIRKIFGEVASKTFLATRRAWLKIALPPEVGDLQSRLNGISLHAMSASNVECLNQTVSLTEDGASIPVSLDEGGKGYLVAPCSIADVRNVPYLPLFHPSPDRNVGRYSIQGGKITLQPAKNPEGVRDKKADVCLWLTAGKLGNRVGSDKVITPVSPHLARELRVLNPTSASGGTNGEIYPDARARFAAALLSRYRIVTRTDVETAARMFDHRIHMVRVQDPELRRSQNGLQRVVPVVISIPEHVFSGPEEVRVFQDELSQHLQRRALYDTLLTVEIKWS